MKTYKVTYTGNASKYKNFSDTVTALSERDATEEVYQNLMDENYFPMDDGSIKDCNGDTIADGDDTRIQYDGGYFAAEEITL